MDMRDRLVELMNQAVMNMPREEYEKEIGMEKVIKCISDHLIQNDVQVVRHGHWERGWNNNNIYAYCTACKRRMDYHCYGYAYCSLCGAEMDGKE